MAMMIVLLCLALFAQQAACQDHQCTEAYSCGEVDESAESGENGKINPCTEANIAANNGDLKYPQCTTNTYLECQIKANEESEESDEKQQYHCIVRTCEDAEFVHEIQGCNVDDCVNEPCGDHGDCTDGPVTYSCTCRDGYTGDNCETDPCASVTCQNCGTCNIGTCDCFEGFSGQNCELASIQFIGNENCLEPPAVYEDCQYRINQNEWLSKRWCAVVDPQEGPNNDAYTVSVDLYADTENRNHLGLAYNVQDARNLDFIYFRPHANGTDDCYRAGWLSYGEKTLPTRGYCPTPLAFKKWFNVKIVVEAGQDYASFYLDGVFVSHDQAMSFPARAKAAVMVVTSYGNVAYFKNLQIE